LRISRCAQPWTRLTSGRCSTARWPAPPAASVFVDAERRPAGQPVQSLPQRSLQQEEGNRRVAPVRPAGGPCRAEQPRHDEAGTSCGDAAASEGLGQQDGRRHRTGEAITGEAASKRPARPQAGLWTGSPQRRNIMSDSPISQRHQRDQRPRLARSDHFAFTLSVRPRQTTDQRRQQKGGEVHVLPGRVTVHRGGSFASGPTRSYTASWPAWRRNSLPSATTGWV